jgi:DUF1016 N-terminal domain
LPRVKDLHMSKEIQWLPEPGGDHGRDRRTGCRECGSAGEYQGAAVNIEPSVILTDIRLLIENARQRAAVAVNSELTLLYWQVGKRIQNEVLNDRRGTYGKQIIVTLAQQLTAEYGKGWSEKQLRHCLRIAEIFTDEAILSTVRRQLSWSHIKSIMYLDDPMKREFYIEVARFEGWSSRQLQERINSQLMAQQAHHQPGAAQGALSAIPSRPAGSLPGIGQGKFATEQ